ncbi:hypothetical protein BC833DRAFT_621097 [Globomyces pollinis-pini]|nr:hypothetical protein BC833DRAFT_621097 [Globomyces pollinis-pini]
MTELVEDIRVSSLVSGPVDLVKDCGLIYADIVSTVVEWTVWKPITTCFLPLAILYQMETQASQKSVETVDPLAINTESSSSIAVPEQSKGKSHSVLAETVASPTREESVDTLYSDEDLVSESNSVGNDGLSREGSDNLNDSELIPVPLQTVDSVAIDSIPIPLPLKVIEKACGIAVKTTAAVIRATVIKPVSIITTPYYFLKRSETVDPLAINTESSSSIAVPEQSKGKSHGVLAETVASPTREESVDTLYSDEDLVSESNSVGNDGLSREGSDNANESELIPVPLQTVDSVAIDSKPIPLPLKVIEQACESAGNTTAAVIRATVIKPVSIITTPYYFLKRCLI